MEQCLGKKSSLWLRANFRIEQKGKLVMRGKLTLIFVMFSKFSTIGMQYFIIKKIIKIYSDSIDICSNNELKNESFRSYGIP